MNIPSIHITFFFEFVIISFIKPIQPVQMLQIIRYHLFVFLFKFFQDRHYLHYLWQYDRESF
jgi:hypothetical protein